MTTESDQTTPQTLCRACVTPIGYIDAPTGGWWAHETHPADEHDAVPGAWVDGDELMEAIAAAVWEHCGTEGTSLIVDDPRNIAGTAAAVARRFADAEQAELRRERDLAIAHDRQPYPTAWAYEQACKALRRKTDVLDQVRAMHRKRTERHGSGCVQCGIVWPCPTYKALEVQPAAVEAPGAAR